MLSFNTAVLCRNEKKQSWSAIIILSFKPGRCIASLKKKQKKKYPIPVSRHSRKYLLPSIRSLHGENSSALGQSKNQIITFVS